MDRFRLMPSYRYYDTEGASPLTLDRSVGKPLRDYKIYGNSVQDGEPTPENPAQVQSVGDKSKNLLNPIFNETIYVNQSSESASIISRTDVPGCIVPVKPNTDYTVHGDYTGMNSGYIRIAYTEEYPAVDVSTVAAGFATNTTKTFTTPENCNYLLVMAGAATVSDYTSNQLQLEEGDTATEYEPYGYKIPVTNRGKNLASELLGGCARSGDGFPGIASNSTVPPEVYKTIRFENIKAGTYTFSFEKPVSIVRSLSTGSHETSTSISARPQINTMTSTVIIEQDEEEYYISFRDATSSTTEWGNAWVQCEEGDTATDYEPYREPETYDIYLNEPLAEGEYIDFINQKAVRSAGEETVSLPTIKTHKGTNIITVGTEVEPSDIKVQYYQ